MIPISERYTSLVYVKPLSWREVFDIWRDLEAWQETWKEHWTEQGFNSWDEWREMYAAPLHPKTLSWELHHISNPLKDLPLFYGTPTKGWIDKAYEGEITKQLRDISNLSIITENQKILSIRRDFPRKTMLTGIIHDGKIVLIEGMHRANALATWNPRTPFVGNVDIALALWNNSIPILGGNRKMK